MRGRGARWFAGVADVGAWVAPLCPAGHLPLKGGERLREALRPHPPLEGEGRSEAPGWGDV
ncbi:hypothetical protein FJQ55_13710 [Rhizobium glycinendophyticum]|uniref:Lytic murein transglycosylase n=1 Tax=Rhizobium glycinendophyticum TaxID=2589807 RepID=A0A504UZD1_9HYPH|nr:hypothetical protein FJQ55_13710 [Rhizobium glycinendophyticum]